MSGFLVTPMSQAVNLKPGEVFEGSINVVNPADAKTDFSYKATVTPYAVTDGEYTADLLEKTNWSQIVDWIEIENPTGILKPNETQAIKFKITVPENSPSGGQYATIAVQSSNEEAEAGNFNVQNVLEIASVVFAKVEGEIVHDGKILSNKVPSFSIKTPVAVMASFENHGNVHELATTTITVNNLFNGERIFPKENAENNSFSEYIMPETTRYAMREVDGLADFGIYKISQEVKYMGKTLTETKMLVVCPIWFLILTVMTIIALILAFFQLRKQRKVKKMRLKGL